jgi:hypothetical protein
VADPEIKEFGLSATRGEALTETSRSSRAIGCRNSVSLAFHLSSFSFNDLPSS